ncbi:MAG TPA: hypothetical protein VFO33_04315 [Casimicrobiaceae bacterium]|nr:hypothetical protein [Casimicrobiaceae bacterium]
MKKLTNVLAVAGVAFATQAAAQPAEVINGAAAADVTTIKAKVNAVDLAKREVTLTGPLGRTVVLKVDERVKNLPQVKAGDELVLKYAEAVSIAVRKGGDAGREKVETATPPVTAASGAKPGVAAARQERLTANIEQLDAKRQVALVQGPGGRYVEVKVKDPAVFKTLAVNDKVDLTFTEAVLIEVVPPAAAKK